ncbi:MAG: hypothetical protein NC227_00005, partial [Bacteroides sp.]|nr:hypothetical protein [Bacteroides sp.]
AEKTVGINNLLKCTKTAQSFDCTAFIHKTSLPHLRLRIRIFVLDYVEIILHPLQFPQQAQE